MLSASQINIMSAKTGISIDTIMRSLGIWQTQAREPVTTIEQAEKLYCILLRGSEEEMKLLLEWIDLCTTSSQVQAVVFRAPNRSFVQAEAIRKWRKLSSDEIDKAKTLEEIIAVHANTPLNSPERVRAMRKWIHFCDHLDQLLEAHKATVRGSNEELMAIRKLCEYYKFA